MLRTACAILILAGVAGCDHRGNESEVIEPGDPTVRIETGDDGADVEAPGVRVETGEGGTDVIAPGVNIEVRPDGTKVDAPRADVDVER